MVLADYLREAMIREGLHHNGPHCGQKIGEEKAIPKETIDLTKEEPKKTEGPRTNYS